MVNNLKSLVFWEKYRPTLIKKGKGIPIILLPRIRKLVEGMIDENGDINISLNLLLYGSGGVGKCVSGNTIVKVRNKDTGEISEVRIDDLL